jgi:hypothetical protein
MSILPLAKHRPRRRGCWQAIVDDLRATPMHWPLRRTLLVSLAWLAVIGGAMVLMREPAVYIALPTGLVAIAWVGCRPARTCRKMTHD